MPGSVYSKSFRATSFARISEVMSARAMLTNDAPIFGPIMLRYSSKSSCSIIMGRQAMF